MSIGEKVGEKVGENDSGHDEDEAPRPIEHRWSTAILSHGKEGVTLTRDMTMLGELDVYGGGEEV